MVTRMVRYSGYVISSFHFFGAAVLYGNNRDTLHLLLYQSSNLERPENSPVAVPHGMFSESGVGLRLALVDVIDVHRSIPVTQWMTM